jgi:hypothetical protein
MCDCITKNSQAVVDHATTQLVATGKAEIDTTASIHNAGMRRVANRLVMAPYDEYRIRTYPLKKDGTKKGNEKMEQFQFVHSYCPHCGEKYPTA